MNIFGFIQNCSGGGQKMKRTVKEQDDRQIQVF